MSILLHNIITKQKNNSEHFASLTIPLVLFHMQGGSWSSEYIVAGIVAFGIGVWKRQVVLSLLTGVITLVCWRMLVGW
ncbi:AzlD domain-containing protein [Bacillus sp. S13(2024)]|uniref:AzlD domain-containing protein n=1 Tax=unclassified Bacillus (in: firmicutes) TaxID=185979 RepID=UPI003D25333A